MTGTLFQDSCGRLIHNLKALCVDGMGLSSYESIVTLHPV